MSHLPAYHELNGRHRAVCPCGWVTPWLSTRADAQHLARNHTDLERHKESWGSR